MKLHLPKMLFAAVLACYGLVQAATISSISEETPITINLNFASGRGAVPNNGSRLTIAGVTTTGSQWTNLSGESGTADVTDSNGKTYKLTFSSPNTWSAGGTPDPFNINQGYLDVSNSGSNGVTVTLKNEDGSAVAWRQINVLLSGDGGSFGAVTLNGTNYYYSGGALTEGAGAWGTRGAAASYTEGTNLMVFRSDSVASAEGITLNGTSNGGRSSFGGLQVVTGYNEAQLTGYQISDFSEGETASLADLVTDQDLTLPLTVNVTPTAATGDVATLIVDRNLNEITAKGGALGLDITQDVTIGAIAAAAEGSFAALGIAEGKTLTISAAQTSLSVSTTGTGKLVLTMVNTPEASGDNILDFGDGCEFESVRIAGGVIATNLNQAARSVNIGSADLIMANGTTYVIRNANGANGNITSGDIVLEGGIDLQVYGSTHNSVISSNIVEASEDATTSLRKTDGGTTTLTGVVKVDSVRVAAGTLVLGDGNKTTTGQIRLSENGSNGNKLRIDSGATLTVTGSVNDHSTSDSIVLAHWGQTGFLEVNGGTLVAENAVALMSWTGVGTLSINSGTAKLSGLNFWGQSYSGTEFKGYFNLGTAETGDGVLELGGTGIVNLGGDGGPATVNLGNGTIRAAADTQITRNTAYSAGVVNLIGTNGGTVFDTNGHSISTTNVTMSGDGDLVKTGEGTLTTGAVTTTGTIKVDEGTWRLEGDASVSNTVINNATIAKGNGKLIIDSLAGFEGEAVYNDVLAPESGNGYMSSANFVVIKAEDGHTSTLDGLTQVTFDGVDYDLVSTDTQSSVNISTSGTGGIYYVLNGQVEYGADDNSAYSDATTGLVVNGGDLAISKALKSGISNIQVLQAAKLTLGEDITLNKTQITGDGAVTLSGSGVFGIGEAVTLPEHVAIASDWTGTLVVENFRFGGDANAAASSQKLNSGLSNANSFVGLTNCTGWLTPGGTVSANLHLLAGDALSLSDGSGGRTQTFSGKIKGEGDFLINMVGKTVTNVTYVFSGDVSEWTGSFKALAASGKAFTVNFTGAGDIGASVSTSNTITLNVNVNGGDRTVNGSIMNEGGTLNLAANGSGTKTFANNINATKITVAGGTTATLEGTTNVGTLSASGTITNKGSMTVSTGLDAAITTGSLELAAAKSSLVKADGVTASDDGNGFVSSGFYYVVHSVDGGSLSIDSTLVSGNYRLEGNDLLYTAAGGDMTVYYINNSIAYTGSDAANVGSGKTLLVSDGAVLSLENTGVPAEVTLSTMGTGTVRLIGSGDWNCESTLGANKSKIGNLATDDGVNAVMSFATLDTLGTAGTKISLGEDSVLKVTAGATTRKASLFNNVSGGDGIVILPNTSGGNLVLDANNGGATTYSGNIEMITNQHILADGKIFAADENGKYADIKLTHGVAGKCLILTTRLCGKENALRMGSLSGNGNIDGAYNNQTPGTVGRYVELHQDADTVFSGLCNNSSADRAVGIIKYGTGKLTLTGTNVSTSDLDIHEGTVAIAEAGKWSGAVMVADGATLDMSEATDKSLTRLTVNGGATLDAGGASIALGTLVLDNVGGNKLITLAGVDTSLKSVDLFTGLADESSITGIEFDTEVGRRAAVANKYIAGVGEDARLVFAGGTLSLVSHISSDYYWKGSDTTWDASDVDWASEADITTADVAYVDSVTAHFVGVDASITVSGERSASALYVTDNSTLSLSATGDDNSLTVTGDLTIEHSSLTLGGNITLGGDIVMGEAASLVIVGTRTIDGVAYSDATIGHATGSDTYSLEKDAFSVNGGGITLSGESTVGAALENVEVIHTGSGTLTLNGTQKVASLTSDGTVSVAGTTTIGGTVLSDGASVTTGGAAFDLASTGSTVTNGSVTTDAGTISAALSDVALTITGDATLNGTQSLASLTTGANTATIADSIAFGDTEISGSALTTGASAFDLASATSTVTGGTVTTGASDISAALSNVALTTTGDTTLSGTQTLTTLTGNGVVSIDGTTTATSASVNALGGTGSLNVTDALALNDGASTIGSLTANSVSLAEGATLSATNLDLTSGQLDIASLAGIGAGNQAIEVTGAYTSTPGKLILGLDLDTLKDGAYTDKNLVIGTVNGLTAAEFTGGVTTITDEVALRNYELSVSDTGVISVSYTSSGNGWLAPADPTTGAGEWIDGGTSEFESEVTSTIDASFLGDGATTVAVVGDKTVAKLNVDIQNDAEGYTFTGDSISADEVEITNGSMTVENKITAADAVTVSSNGTVTVEDGGTLEAGSLTTTGELTNNGTITVTGDSTGDLTNNGTLTVGGDSTGDLTNNGTITVGGDADGTITNAGTLTIAGAATGVVDNSGTLSIGTASDVSVGGTGNLTATGDAKATLLDGASIATATAAGSATLTLDSAADEISVAMVAGSGKIKAVGKTLAVAATAEDSAVDLTTSVLDVSGSDEQSFGFGSLNIDRLIFSSDNVGATALISAEEVSTVTATKVTLEQDETSAVLAVGEYKMITLDTAIDAADYKLDDSIVAYYQSHGMAVALSTEQLASADASGLGRAGDSNTLYMIVVDDNDRTWKTGECTLTDAFGNTVVDEHGDDVLVLDPNGYTMYAPEWETVNHVVLTTDPVYGGDETVFDLTQDAPTAEVPSVVLTNIMGDSAGKSMSVIGDGIDEDKVTLRTTDGYAPGANVVDMSLDKVTADVDGSPVFGNVTMTSAKLGSDGNTVSVSSLKGDADSVLAGNLKVIDSYNYDGAYAPNSRVTMDIAKGGEMVVNAAQNLTLASGPNNKATLVIAQKPGSDYSMTAIDTDKTTVVLASNGQPLELTGSQSAVRNGTLKTTVDVNKVLQSPVDGMSAQKITTQGIGMLDVSGTNIVLNGQDEHSVSGTVNKANGTSGVIIATLSTGEVVSDGTTVTLGDGFLSKFYRNARVQGNNIVADVVTDYYTSNLQGLSGTGALGASMLDGVLLDKNPQGNADKYTDLAKVLDSMDQYVGSGNTEDADRLGAAVAGAGTAILGTAFAGDVERQLRAIRNRTTTMGVESCVVHEGMPYYNAWINAEGDYRKVDKDGMDAGYTNNSWGGTVGMDVDLTPNVTLGLALTAMYGDLDGDSAETSVSGDLDTYYMSLFGRVVSGAWVHTFVGTVGISDITLKRTVAHPNGSYSTSGNTNGFGLGLMYEVGYVIAANEDSTVCWQPVANIALKHVSIDGYTEQGSDAALHIGKQDMTSVTFGLGVRMQAAIAETIYNRTSILELRALAKVEAGDRYSKATVTMLNQADRDGSVRSSEVDAFGVEFGAGVTIPVGTVYGGAIFMDASAELRGSYTNVNGTVGYRFNF